MGYGTDFLFTGSGLIPPSSNAHMYQAPILSQLLHTIPRYNLTLHRTNNTFRIRDDVYLEVRKRATDDGDDVLANIPPYIPTTSPFLYVRITNYN